MYQSAKQAMDETFFQLGIECLKKSAEIANHLNTVVKVHQFSTECTNAFIANVYIKSKKIVISYQMSVRPSFFYTNRHFSGVTTPFYRC